MLFEEDELIHSYPRAEALADGVLVDVSPLARLLGFRYPMAVTAGVYAAITSGVTGEAAKQGRLSTMLRALREAVRQGAADEDTIEFTADLTPQGSLSLWSRCGPGDTPDPVLTVMLPDED